MSRPIRIEYEDAYYHVMNRGRSRQKIFHGVEYYEAFLATLSEAHQRFGLEVLSYCLMGNHYHLLVKTPEANLGRIMRHVNGVYTQRYNRIKNTAGPLFIGRYKAICVEADSYQLQLSRYIHRNPLEAKLVQRLDDYPWSSYGYFVSAKKPPCWLYTKAIYEQLGTKTRVRAKYRAFVDEGVDDELARFYSKGNITPYLGSESFRDWVYGQRDAKDNAGTKRMHRLFRPGMDEIIETVAKQFKVKKASLMVSRRGRVESNIPRWVAMYVAQEVGGFTLKSIAENFGLKTIGSIPVTIKKLRLMLETDGKLRKKLLSIKAEYGT